MRRGSVKGGEPRLQARLGHFIDEEDNREEVAVLGPCVLASYPMVRSREGKLALL